MDENFKVYAIVVTFNGERWIEKSVSSLLQSSVPLIPIIIDNHSTDSTVSILKAKFPGVLILENEKNRGFGQANNLGIKYAMAHDADFVFLLNQDAWIFENTIKNMLEVYTPEYGILGPVQLCAEGNDLELNFKKNLAPAFLLQTVTDYWLGVEKKINDASFISAAGWLIPAMTIQRIGGFDPLFFHYGEDNNYCHRVSYHGLKIGLVINAHICHDSEENGFLNYPGHKEIELKVILSNINIPWKHGWIYLEYKKEMLLRERSLKVLENKRKKMEEFMIAYESLKKNQTLILKSREINQSEGLLWL